MGLAPCPPQATVYCHECGRNRQVASIRVQRLTSMEHLRETSGKTACGHTFRCMVTLANLAIMREWLPVDKSSG